MNVHKSFEGPIHDGYHPHKDGEKNKDAWLPCSAKDHTLHINTAVRLADERPKGQATKGGNGQASSGANTAKGAITVDSIDGRFKQHLNLAWKKC
jgi:hypothetical protein